MKPARRRLIFAAGALAAAPLVRAQSRGGAPTLGLLSFGRRPTADVNRRFFAKLKSLGWAIGENLNVEYAYAGGRLERLPELAEGLVRKNVDVIWVVSPPAAVAAARATRSIPIVFVRVVWPIELGLGESLTRPGGNVTGVASIADPATLVKPMEFLLEIAPIRRGIGLAPHSVIYKTVSGGTFSPPIHTEMEERMNRLGIQRRVYYVDTARDIDAAFEDAVKFGPEGLYVSSGPILVAEMRRIVDFALRLRLPSGFIEAQFVQAGGLLSYGSDIWGTIFQSLDYVDAILRGAKPAELPIQLPKKLELAINRVTADRIGVTIPSSLLLRADKVIG